MDLGDLVRRRHPYQSRFIVRGYRLLRAGAERLGLQVVLKTFYSPIPDLRRLPPRAFERASPLAGLSFDLGAQLQWARDELAAPMAEFAPAAAAAATRPSTRAAPRPTRCSTPPSCGA